MIKKILVLFLTLIFAWGCDGIGDGAVNPGVEEINVGRVTAPLSFTKTESDSTVTAVIEFESLPGNAEVYLNMETEDGGSSIYDNLPLNNPDSRNPLRYQAEIIMSGQDPSTNYTIIFYVNSALSGTRKVAAHSLSYNNGSNNAAPVITKVEMPDTVIVEDESLAFGLYATVEDSNGLRDIDEVWLTVVKPDGTNSGAKTFMYDNGSADNGDEVPADGVFSRIIRIDPQNDKGKYIFQFRASDSGGKMSDIVKREIYIL